MRIIYFCQRLHPNFVDSLVALSKEHDVKVLVRSDGLPNERIACLNVEVYPESLISKALSSFSNIVGQTVSSYDECFPSFRFMFRSISSQNCDLVYVRYPKRLHRSVWIVAKVQRCRIFSYVQEICPKVISPKDNRIFPLSHFYESNQIQVKPPVNFIPLSIELNRDFGEAKSDHYVPDGLSQLRLIHVGKLIERKGQMIILEAISALVKEGMNIHLSLYSHTPPNAYREKLLTVLKDLMIAENVEFMPSKTPDEMLLEYRKHDVFVYSGWVRETLDLDVETYARATGTCGTRLYSLIEAMAAGLPVVCASERHVVGAVENGGNGLVFEKGNAADLVCKIKDISVMDLNGMGARSRALIEAHHDAKDFSARFTRFVMRNK